MSDFRNGVMKVLGDECLGDECRTIDFKQGWQNQDQRYCTQEFRLTMIRCIKTIAVVLFNQMAIGRECDVFNREGLNAG